MAREMSDGARLVPGDMAQGIYLLTCVVNGKVYVGQSINIKRRLKEHKTIAAQGRQTQPIYRAIRKYGWDNFEVEILELVSDREDLTAREQFWLDHYQSFNEQLGYNLSPTAGSRKDYKQRPETIEKLKREMQRRMQNPEYAAKLMEKYKDFRTNPEIKKHHAEAQRRRFQRPLEKFKLLARLRGRVTSSETIEKLRQCALKYARPVIKVDSDTGVEISRFLSIADVISSGEGSRAGISTACHLGKKYRGYLWRFEDVVSQK